MIVEKAAASDNIIRSNETSNKLTAHSIWELAELNCVQLNRQTFYAALRKLSENHNKKFNFISISLLHLRFHSYSYSSPTLDCVLWDAVESERKLKINSRIIFHIQFAFPSSDLRLFFIPFTSFTFCFLIFSTFSCAFFGIFFYQIRNLNPPWTLVNSLFENLVVRIWD